MMEAATLGALFLLAALGPGFVAGATDLSPVDSSKTEWVVVIGVISAAGIGALLQLTGRALWEFVFPLSPQGGWRGLPTLAKVIGKIVTSQKLPKPPDFEALRSTRVKDFRAEIARSDPQQDYWKLANRTAGPFVEGGPILSGQREDESKEPDWSYGNRVVIAAEYFLYSEAPDGLLQWIRRRYQRFVDAVSASVAILLGVGFGVFHPGQDLGRMLVLNGALVVVAAGTFAFANENRHLAQKMETYWYNVLAKKQKEDVQSITGFDSTQPSAVAPASQVVLVRADVKMVGASTAGTGKSEG
jgi:hypothetical protein